MFDVGDIQSFDFGNMVKKERSKRSSNSIKKRKQKDKFTPRSYVVHVDPSTNFKKVIINRLDDDGEAFTLVRAVRRTQEEMEHVKANSTKKHTRVSETIERVSDGAIIISPKVIKTVAVSNRSNHFICHLYILCLLTLCILYFYVPIG